MNRMQLALLLAADRRGWIVDKRTGRVTWLYKVLRPKWALRVIVARACFDIQRAVGFGPCCAVDARRP